MARAPTVEPAGLVYRPELLTAAEEAGLLSVLRGLRFDPIVLHGQEAKRTARHFGLRLRLRDAYAARGRARPGLDRPGAVARRRPPPPASGPEGQGVEVLVQRYPAGSTIGWHRDAPAFGIVAGISLGGAGADPLPARRRAAIAAVGEVRSSRARATSSRARPAAWQHSIPPTKESGTRSRSGRCGGSREPGRPAAARADARPPRPRAAGRGLRLRAEVGRLPLPRVQEGRQGRPAAAATSGPSPGTSRRRRGRCGVLPARAAAWRARSSSSAAGGLDFEALLGRLHPCRFARRAAPRHETTGGARRLRPALVPRRRPCAGGRSTNGVRARGVLAGDAAPLYVTPATGTTPGAPRVARSLRRAAASTASSRSGPRAATSRGIERWSR